MPIANEIIAHLGLEPLAGEGGFFKQTYVSREYYGERPQPEQQESAKPLCTAIYYLLTSEPDSFSAIHKLPTDEIYHHYIGDPVGLLELHPKGSSRQVILGADILKGQIVQHVVPANVWQGSQLLSGGEFALMGTTMAPGFTADDYVGGVKELLVEQFPAQQDIIRKLTRDKNS
jgi:uncharacterized protein